MKMTTRVAYCNMRHYKSKNILIGIAIILTTLLLFVIPSIGKDMVEVNFAVINKIMGFSLLSEMEFFAVPKNGISLNI